MWLMEIKIRMMVQMGINAIINASNMGMLWLLDERIDMRLLQEFFKIFSRYSRAFKDGAQSAGFDIFGAMQRHNSAAGEDEDEK